MADPQFKARQVVSYDDISPPADPVDISSSRPHYSQQPLTKKRKKNNQKQFKQQSQRWDEPPTHYRGETNGASYGPSSQIEEEEEGDGEDSRELTYEEIWDDSALVDAWDAANEEYEAYHGPDKGWKTEPVHKSPLWHNIPPSPSKLRARKPQANIDASDPGASNDLADPGDSRPVNFDTFVPNHDPSLAGAGSYPGVHMLDPSVYSLPEATDSTISQDEAFNRALGAMYWAGYYTAIYHAQKRSNLEGLTSEEDMADEDEDEILVEDQDEGLVPTQR